LDQAKQIKIRGIVQGVGFRPFLYGLALRHNLVGQVANTADGVDLRIEGREASLEAFISDIPVKRPVISRITSMAIEPVAPTGARQFEIVESRGATERFTLISPDVCVCKECLDEMKDPGNRRFEYPFINCTNCGPRFTIISDVPYDRPKTSMRNFEMCADCNAEYEDPTNRRFHAQPNACPVCGPHVFIANKDGALLGAGGNAIELGASLLKEGKILAVKGLGGFHLAVDAANESAVQRLRELKGRPDKPFALMAASVFQAAAYVEINDAEEQLLTSYHRPIVLLEKKDDDPGIRLAPSIAPYNTCLGIMLPYTPLHYLLLDKGPDVLVMTSGNRSGEPLSIDNDDAFDAFAHIADAFLFHDRDIYFRADDSIMRVQKAQGRFLRRSRGYAPLPVDLKPLSGKVLPRVMGCGAGLKATVCLTRERYGFLSQHIGDLENIKVNGFYDHTISHLKKITDIEPEIIAHDLHSGYYSTAWAKRKGEDGIPLLGVQHHHAHALSCMAENHLDGEVIALTLDGTGLGSDGHIWGGEVLTCTYESFERRARLLWLPMPGGDAAAREPWRMAAALLYKVYGRDFLGLDIPYIKEMNTSKLEFLAGMMEKQVNTPLTSSAGRLFDAISSLLCIRHEITHESQAAMALEAVANSQDIHARYHFEVRPQDDGCSVLDIAPAVDEIVGDIKAGRPAGIISAKFHNTLVAFFVAAAVKVRDASGLNRVVLSGGVFNNDRIFSGMIEALESCGFSVYTHSLVPCGDGGIALGQAMAAAAKWTRDH